MECGGRLASTVRTAATSACADHLAAEHALPAGLRRAAAEQVHVERLEVENGEQILDGGGHGRDSGGAAAVNDAAGRG